MKNLIDVIKRCIVIVWIIKICMCFEQLNRHNCSYVFFGTKYVKIHYVIGTLTWITKQAEQDVRDFSDTKYFFCVSLECFRFMISPYDKLNDFCAVTF